MKATYTITKDISIGIYEGQYIARIYKDKIIIVSPYIKWAGNNGTYAEKKEAIRDPRVVDAILADVAGGRKGSAWAKIGRNLGDVYLALTA